MTTTFDRLMDEMLAAQSRFAQSWRDGEPLTTQQRKDEAVRDICRDAIRALFVLAEMAPP